MILSTSGIAQKFSDPLAAVVIGGLLNQLCSRSFFCLRFMNGWKCGRKAVM